MCACVWQTLKSWADRIDNNNRGGKIAGAGRDRKRAKVILIPSTFAVCVTYRDGMEIRAEISAEIERREKYRRPFSKSIFPGYVSRMFNRFFREDRNVFLEGFEGELKKSNCDVIGKDR